MESSGETVLRCFDRGYRVAASGSAPAGTGVAGRGSAARVAAAAAREGTGSHQMALFRALEHRREMEEDVTQKEIGRRDMR